MNFTVKSCAIILGLILLAVRGTAARTQDALHVFDTLQPMLTLQPVNEKDWRQKEGVKPRARRVRLDFKLCGDVIRTVGEAIPVLIEAGKRRKAHEEALRAQGYAELPMSKAALRERIDILGQRFYFDRYGELWYDARFVDPAKRPVLKRLEALYRRLFPSTRSDEEHARLEMNRPVPDAHGWDVPLLDRAAERASSPIPIFRGFEDDRYQEHDALIVRLVTDFNAHRGDWAGATPEQVQGIADLTPALVKAHMIEETGGNDARSRAAWAADPEQVNVPGDWCAAKAKLGLQEPKVRNEGTCEGNVKAAIMFLVRKGFSSSGQPASDRARGCFDGWLTALKRYNGRLDETASGLTYRDAYAARILQRAEHPDDFTPIRIRLKEVAK